MIRTARHRRRSAPATLALAALLLGTACDDAPTDVPPPPIELSIISPAEGSALSQGKPVVLLATATAADVGPLPDDSVRWSVDAEPLAPGRSHTLQLDPGEHVLEVEARYGERTAQQARTVTVGAVSVGTVLWRSGAGVSDWAGLSAGEDGTLYVQDESTHALLMLGPDGSVRRRRGDLPSSFGEYAVAVLDDGSVVFGTWQGVMALTPEGLTRWSYSTAHLVTGYRHVHGGVAVGRDGTIYFGVEDAAGIVVALWPDGRERWTTSVRGADTAPWRFISPPVIAGDSLVVIVERLGQRIAALDARTGQVMWRYGERVGSTTLPIPYVPAIAQNGDVVAALSAELVRLDAAGNVVWATTDPGSFWAIANAPAIAGDRIYLPTTGGAEVYGLDGTHVATFGAAGGIIFGAVTVGRGGVVYVLTREWLRSFAPDGTLRYEVAAGSFDGWQAPSGPVLAADGTVFVVSPTDGLIAIADTVGPSPDAAWPTSGGGFRRLGRRH